MRVNSYKEAYEMAKSAGDEVRTKAAYEKYMKCLGM